jgi:hypothetical protein
MMEERSGHAFRAVSGWRQVTGVMIGWQVLSGKLTPVT